MSEMTTSCQLSLFGIIQGLFLLRNWYRTGNFPFNRCPDHPPLEGNNAATVFRTLQKAVSGVPPVVHPSGQVFPSILCLPALMRRNWVQASLRTCISRSGMCKERRRIIFLFVCLLWRARSERRGRWTYMFNPSAVVHLNLIFKRKWAPLYPLSFLPRWQRRGGAAGRGNQSKETWLYFSYPYFLCLGFTRVEWRACSSSRRTILP